MEVKECVGCGYCCMKTPCDVSRRLYPGATVCPQLIWSDKKERYICGLMSIKTSLGEEYKKELHAGTGCCCSLNSWRNDVKKRVSIEATYVNPIPTVMQMFLKALTCQFISWDVIFLTLNHMKNDMLERGYDKSEVDNIIQGIIYIFTNNRSSFTKEFMG